MSIIRGIRASAHNRHTMLQRAKEIYDNNLIVDGFKIDRGLCASIKSYAVYDYRLLADRMRYEFIDNEDLFFPKEDPLYTFSNPRSKEEVIRLLEERISGNNRFIFAAVRGNYGDRLIAALDHIVLIEVPKQIRNQRVRDRSYQKFGDRILPGGDLYDKESKWFSLTNSRPETYVTDWLETVGCPVIRIDGTLPVEENVDYLVSVLSKEDA